MTKTAKTNYVAKLDGKIVGTRASHRVYTHAVVIQWSEDHARERANSDVEARACAKLNWDWYVKNAAHTIEAYKAEWKYDSTEEAQRRIDEGKAHIEGGFDAEVERMRAANIARFDQALANGGFKPGVAAWSGRRDLAEKEAAKFRNYKGNSKVANVWVVEAEVVTKLVKIKENKHLVYGPR